MHDNPPPENHRGDASMIGVVLMTFGSATTAQGVRPFMQRVRQGKASEESIKEIERRYALIGRSPLVDITSAQAAALETMLGGGFVVRAGMRHSEPSIDAAAAECKDAGAQKLVGVILSPQYSAFIMGGYDAAFKAAAEKHGFKDARIAAPWPDEPHFVELIAARVRAALAQLPEGTPVIFTTHALPERVVANDPGYLDQIARTVSAVRAELDPALAWRSAYQSAGHAPEPWLKPDLTEVLAALARDGARHALIAPIQFLADHLEILYDLDIAARAQCEAAGIGYRRIELPNADPLFIEALASVVLSTGIEPALAPSEGAILSVE